LVREKKQVQGKGRRSSGNPRGQETTMAIVMMRKKTRKRRKRLKTLTKSYSASRIQMQSR
jgi:hypothetical protein